VRFYFTEQVATALINATGCGTCTTISDAYVAGITKFSGASSVENGTLADNVGNYLFINQAQVEIVPFNNGYYAEFKVRDFSEFWISNGGVNFSQPLPLTLLSFRGSTNYPDALLFWETAAENNTSHFEVERRLDSDQQFVKVGTVAAAGQSAQKRSYRFTDPQSMRLGTTLHYRLKMVDADGHYLYSPVIVLKGGDEDVFIKYVAPTAGSQLFITTGHLPGVQQMQIRILSAAGQTLISQQAPYQTTQLNIRNLPAGIYLIEIREQGGSRRYIQKFTKE